MTHYFGLACIVVYLVALAFVCPPRKDSMRNCNENHKFSDGDGE